MHTFILPPVDPGPLIRPRTRHCAGGWPRLRNKLHAATALVLVAGVSMSTSAFQVSAAEVSFQFTAELGYVYGTGNSEFAAMFGIGDTLSGSLTYDTDLAPYYQHADAYGTYSSFDFLSAPSLTSSLFVSELSHTFQLDLGNLGIYTDGSGDSFDLSTVMENVASLQNEQINVGLYLGDYDGGMLSTTDTLPSDIDFNLVDYGEFYVYGGETEAYAQITAFFLDIGNDQEPGVDPDGNLILGATQSELFTLETGELLQTNKTTVGLFENSTFVQQGGTHTTADLLVGGDANEWATGQGTYLLQGGTLNSGFAEVGPYGEGDFVQSGGTHNAEWLMIGNVGRESAINGPSAIGIGEYTMTGGTLNVGLSVTVGGHGQGTFSQSGGDVVIGSPFIQNPNVGQLRIGTGPSQYDPDDFVIAPSVRRGGSYTLGNGTLTVYGQTILGSGSDFSGDNFGGRGEFNHSGGTVFIRDDLVVGEAGTSASGTGQYVISGGSLTVGGDLRVADNSGGGNAAEGLFFQTGGSVDVGGDIVIGESDTIVPNAYTIRGVGTTTANRVEVGLGGTASGQARLEVSNGGLLTGDVFINGNGILTGDGGTIGGNVTLNGGLLAPGSSPGTMSILGDLFLIGGALQLEVGPGLFDQLIVGGNLLLGDDFLIDLIFDSDPFDTAFDLTGLFDVTGDIVFASGFSLADSLHITGLDAGTQLLVSLYDEQFTYSASAVPVPAAAWLLCSGLLALLGVSRRR